MLRVRALGLRLETLAALSRDGHPLLATRGIRMFGQGFIGIALALYLAELGLSADETGLVFTVSLACGAALTVVLARVTVSAKTIDRVLARLRTRGELVELRPARKGLRAAS